MNKKQWPGHIVWDERGDHLIDKSPRLMAAATHPRTQSTQSEMNRTPKGRPSMVPSEQEAKSPPPKKKKFQWL